MFAKFFPNYPIYWGVIAITNRSEEHFKDEVNKQANRLQDNFTTL
jgi:hypothetical protein